MKRPSALLFMFVAAFAAATTVVPMSVERLTQASTDVVRAQAVETWSSWNAAHTQIFTYTRFSEAKRMKGARAATFIVKQMGGSAGGYTQHVAGVRHFLRGDEAVLFLRPSEAADGTYAVVGLMQGAFRVRRSAAGEPTVSNGVQGVETFDRASGKIGVYTGRTMRLSELESAVERAKR